MSNLETKLERSWYGDSNWTLFLLPLSWLFQTLSFFRKKLQTAQSNKLANFPVVIVGNISVGGTGKTPLIIALAEECIRQGYQPGIISRGYGSQAPRYPYQVTPSSPVTEAGDEPLLIAKSTQCPVVIGANRNEALKYLLHHNTCNLVLSDDGLQHYKLHRDIEIVVIDGSRGLGNGYCLPAGPLRESPTRLNTVDFVIVNSNKKVGKILSNVTSDSFTLGLKTCLWRRVVDDSEGYIEDLSAIEKIHAVTGIGNPERFFRSLLESNVELIKHTFPDHHPFILSDITFNDGLPVVMTAKDAVKCHELLLQSELPDDKKNRYWYLPIETKLSPEFIKQFFSKIKLTDN